MLIAAVAFAAVVGQAANVSWSTGALYAPKSATDGTKTTTKASADGYSVSVTVMFFADDNNAKGAAIEGLEGTSSTSYTGTGAVGAITSGTQFVYESKYWVEGTVTLTKGSDTWTMAIAPTQFTQTKANGNFNMNLSASLPTSWTPEAVPEPTSGILLVLGMAGLALKRKRA